MNKWKNKMKKIHLSLDDVEIYSMLLENKSDFMLSKLGIWLNKLYSRYGCKLSLYIQNWDAIENIETQYFKNINGNWLKLGIHTTSDGRPFSDVTYLEAKEQWELFCSTIIKLGGDNTIIDRFPRLHTFSGSKDCLTGMRDAGICPAVGFLSADDSRGSYYFSETVTEDNMKDHFLYDNEIGIYFKSTDIRLDWFDKSFNSKYSYNKPEKKTPYKELAFKETRKDYDGNVILEVFTHQWQIFRNGHMTIRKRWIEDVCKFARDYGYEFEFTMNLVNNTVENNVNDSL